MLKLRIVRKKNGKQTWGHDGIRQYTEDDELQFYDPTVQDEEIRGWTPVPIVKEEDARGS